MSAMDVTTPDSVPMEEDKDYVMVEKPEEVGEDVSDLQSSLDTAIEMIEKHSVTPISDIATSVPAILQTVLQEDQDRFSTAAVSIKEQAIYNLTKVYCLTKNYEQIVGLLTGDVCHAFFSNVTKAKCARVIRQVLDLICDLIPEEYSTQETICRQIISWCTEQKRSFLRQRVEAKLATVLYARKEYSESLSLIDELLIQLKKLDDKQLLVEIHLIESKVHFALRGLQKAKAALTASRTAAGAIYVAPSMQASIDSMSGILHCEERDYDTAHSYFLEAFEQLDQLDDRERALPCLKYMMLCRILDSLGKALKLSAVGGVGSKTTKRDVDLSNIITPKQSLKYGGEDIDAMNAIAAAASSRSLKDFEATTKKYTKQLQTDLLIKHHLEILNEQLLESNLIRIIEPYSCVEITHVASLIEMPLHVVEKKLSQMILDSKFKGILDQGKGQLIVYEEGDGDMAMEKGLEVIANMDNVVTSLFARSQILRSL